MKIGIGYDAHRLVKERKLILGGIDIPHEKGLLGHSDADVLIHAIIDAILGALNLGSIGDLFPDTDPKYKGISSLLLLKEVAKLITKKSYRVENIDSIIVAEKPKLKPYIESIKTRLANALAIDIDLVSVKATTTENMGFEGRKEGISAHAVILLDKLK
jgi:2-C-methyl-D-erythritol 2,4-cyclodiphosphate synthase